MWRALARDNASGFVDTVTLSTEGVLETDLEGTFLASVLGSAGNGLFTADPGTANVHLICFVESLGASATGYLLPESEASYEVDVQPIFDRRCATGSACHVTGGTAPISLERGPSWYEIAGQPAVGAPARILVSSGSTADSYLFEKISSPAPAAGAPMPPGSDRLPQVEIETIRRWILEGAKLNSQRLPAAPPGLGRPRASGLAPPSPRRTAPLSAKLLLALGRGAGEAATD